MSRKRVHNKISMEFAAPRDRDVRASPMRNLIRVLLLTLPLMAGCKSCDRPRLLDRLFHRDDDCPSSRAAARTDRSCDAACLSLGAPVSYTVPPTRDPMTLTPPDAGFAQPSPASPANELPPARRIDPTLVPGGR